MVSFCIAQIWPASSGFQEDPMDKYKHLDLEARITIEMQLDRLESFHGIGSLLGKDCTTISKEVRGHRVFEKTGAIGIAFIDCELCHSHSCRERAVCEHCSGRHGRFCWSCGRCRSSCPSYKKYSCPNLDKPPYVCNGCPDRRHCSLEKALYKASYAQKEYDELKSESRSGPALNEKELERLDLIFSPRILKGQSVHFICTTEMALVMKSERSIYKYVDMGLFSARNLDMPRTVRMRPRRNVSANLKVDRSCRIGRTYEDYQAFMKAHPDLSVVEMDSVEGVKGGAVLLTLHFVRLHLQLAFRRDANDSRSVTNIFERLYLELGMDMFSRLFAVILTDNGSEFSDPGAIEKDLQGNPRARVFYCHPDAPFEKGSCENNHEMIRRCIPKGVDIGQYTQEQIDFMMSNINSYARGSLGDKAPYDVFEFAYGEKPLRTFALKRIPDKDIILSPEVFR